MLLPSRRVASSASAGHRMTFVSISSLLLALTCIFILCFSFIYVHIACDGTNNNDNNIGIIKLGGGPYRYGTKPWRKPNITLSATTLVETPFIRIENHAVRILETGKILKDWLWVDIADQVNVLAERESDGKFILFRQRKYGLESDSFAVVGGLIEKGELAQDAAKRELNEELGLESNHWTSLGKYRTDVNRGGGYVNLFLARHCRSVALSDAKRSDDLERQVQIPLTLDELKMVLLNGEIGEVKWTAAVALALLHIEQQQQTQEQQQH
eukprot:PhM_4_TR14301/c0_g1_i1/m.45867